jgi:hypothetical protein
MACDEDGARESAARRRTEAGGNIGEVAEKSFTYSRCSGDWYPQFICVCRSTIVSENVLTNRRRAAEFEKDAAKAVADESASGQDRANKMTVNKKIATVTTKESD